jgi:putative peptidoglycan lipid II flippase
MQMDAYNVAFRIPNLLRDLFAEGAMTAAFVPTFTRVLAEKGRAQAWRLGNLVINGLLLITGVVVVLGIVFADPITGFIAAPEFASVPGKLDLTANLTRLMLPFLTTVAVAVAMMGMLNALHRFFIPSVSPAMFNVATILAVVFLVPVAGYFGLPAITAVAVGTLLGGIGQVLVQWPVLRREGFRYSPVVDFRDPGLRQVLRLMIPGTMGVAAVQVNVLVNTYLATNQEQGAVSWLGYAFRLMYLPIGLFGVSIATAALTDVSRHAAASDTAAIRRTVSSALRMMLVLNVPATIGLVVLAEPIVALLYERNAFNATDTAATAAALMCYAPGLLGYSAVKIASPTFFTLGDSRTPAVVSVISIAANLALNLMLVRTPLGFRGLALGTAISAMLNAGLLLWLLNRRIGGVAGRDVWTALGKITLASGVMAVAAVYASEWLAGLGGPGELVKALRLFGSIGIAILALAAAAKLLRLQELDQAARRILRRIAPGASR